ncbi:hypothetical protein P691DRAFT_522268 [Macrolepiota fuliginosa MF-IS2]|uniref:GIY-YIG domain-containing protein n=1 Tax=Macrolepiota fuliginosa MF-IS2 TaxID=1400762 RepID=A0A9P6C9E7_9AGAR|nr:hypothetical protein P691DRAFT_522268 [Macrolepiota fuliginosa MF-IS2]
MSRAYSFPTFYCCYLLKSAHSLRSYKNYIGSAPDPARRLRKHNGDLTGGARKTAAYRPWIMQLLVHGFPSRSAATSFEYAWQNHHKSRYLRDKADNPLFQKRGARLEQNILVLQTMIRTHPFSIWPLHVKIFTEEALRCWDVLTSVPPSFLSSLLFRSSSSACELHANGNEFTKQYERLHNTQRQYGPLFPPGFTCSVELEGLDGLSGLRGSGRTGPIHLTDEHFTSPYLAKHAALVASGHPLKCSICSSPIHDFASNHLGTTLCTHTGCTSVSHLTCLTKEWLEAERRPVSSPHSPLLPSSTSASVSTSIISASTSSLHLPASSLIPRSSKPTTPASTSIPIPINAHVVSNPFNLGKGMIPRGGTCSSCRTYTLWGDIVKGCYRRRDGCAPTPVEEELDEGEEEALSLSGHSGGGELAGGLDLLSLGGSAPRRSSKVKGKKKASSATKSSTATLTTGKRGRPRKVKVDSDVKPERELNPSSSPTSARKRGRPRKVEPEPELGLEVDPSPTVTKRRKRRGKEGLTSTNGAISESGPSRSELLEESVSASVPTGSDIPRRRGRPRKLSLTSSATIPSVDLQGSDIVPDVQPRPSKRRGRPTKPSPFDRFLLSNETPEIHPEMQPSRQPGPSPVLIPPNHGFPGVEVASDTHSPLRIRHVQPSPFDRFLLSSETSAPEAAPISPPVVNADVAPENQLPLRRNDWIREAAASPALFLRRK